MFETARQPTASTTYSSHKIKFSKKAEKIEESAKFFVTCFLDCHYHQARLGYKKLEKHYGATVAKKAIFAAFHEKVQLSALSETQRLQLNKLFLELGIQYTVKAPNKIAPENTRGHPMPVVPPTVVVTTVRASRDLAAQAMSVTDELQKFNHGFLSDFLNEAVKKAFEDYVEKNRNETTTELKRLFDATVEFVKKIKESNQENPVDHAEQILKIIIDSGFMVTAVSLQKVANTAFHQFPPLTYYFDPAQKRALLIEGVAVKPLQMVTRYSLLFQELIKRNEQQEKAEKISLLDKQFVALLKEQDALLKPPLSKREEQILKMQEQKAKITLLQGGRGWSNTISTRRINGAINQLLPQLTAFITASEKEEVFPFLKRKQLQENLLSLLHMLSKKMTGKIKKKLSRNEIADLKIVFDNMVAISYFCQQWTTSPEFFEQYQKCQQKIASIIEKAMQSTTLPSEIKEAAWACSAQLFADGHPDAGKAMLAELINHPVAIPSISPSPLKAGQANLMFVQAKQTLETALPRSGPSPHKIIQFAQKFSRKKEVENQSLVFWQAHRNAKMLTAFEKIGQAFVQEKKIFFWRQKKNHFDPNAYIQAVQDFTQAVVSEVVISLKEEKQQALFFKKVTATTVERILPTIMKSYYLQTMTDDALKAHYVCLQQPDAQAFFTYLQRVTSNPSYAALLAYREGLIQALQARKLELPLSNTVSMPIKRESLDVISAYQKQFSDCYPLSRPRQGR